MAAAKPVIVLCSRTLATKELEVLHRFCSVLEFNPAYHADKQLSTLAVDVVLLDIRNRKTRECWGVNAKDFAPADTVVWLRAPNDSVDESELDSFKYKFTVKNINTHATDKNALLNSLKGVHVGRVVGRWKKLFRGFLSCVLGLAKK